MDILPLEMLAEVFRRLETSDLKSCRTTSLKWKSLIDAIIVQFNTSLNNENFDEIVNTNLNQLTVRVHNFDAKCRELHKPKSRNPFFSKLTDIDFITWYDPEINYFQLQKNAFRLLEMNQNLTTLEFGPGFWETKSRTFAPLLHFQNLKFFKISTRFAKKALSFFVKVSAPSLQKMCVRDVSFCKDFKNYIAIYKFVSLFASTLKEIDIRHDDAQDIYDGRLSVQCSSSVTALLDTLKCFQPLCLNIAFHPREGMDYSIGVSLCQSMVSLMVLEVSLPQTHCLEIPLAHVIMQNKYSLRCVRVGSRNPEFYNNILFSISTCVCLETLDLDNINIPGGSVQFPKSLKKVRLLGLFEEAPAWLAVLANEASLEELIFANYEKMSLTIYNSIVDAKQLKPTTSYYLLKSCVNGLNNGIVQPNRTFRMKIGTGFRTRWEKFVNI